MKSIEELILTHLAGDLTDKDQADLNEFKNASEENRRLVEELTNPKLLREAHQRSLALDPEAALQEARKRLGMI